MNILIWSPCIGWYSTNYSPHFYLFTTHYKHHGKFPNKVNWFTIPDLNPDLTLEIKKIKPDAVFLGIYPWNKKLLLEFINLCQKIIPLTPVFIGGVSISFYNLDEFLNYQNLVGIIQGEGEVPITQIIDNLVENVTLNHIPGVWLREKNQFNKPFKAAPRISYKNGLGPKGEDFFEVEYSWLIENQIEIFNDIKNNIALRPKDLSSHDLYFIWESSRGCPYECVYCDWGGGIATKIRRKPTLMILKELDVIFDNLDSFGSNLITLHITDANFGIFKEDIKTSEYMVEKITNNNLSGKIFLSFTFAKNNHDTVKEILDILTPVKNSVPWNLDIQSTDKGVLESIKRIQVPIEIISKKYDIKENKNNFSTNMMLALPGSNFEKDLKTCCDILDSGSQINGYLTTVPPQSEMYGPEYKEKWQIQTFITSHEHTPISLYNVEKSSNIEIIYMNSCKSFSTDEYIDILIAYEILQLLDGCFVTRFARILANKNGFNSYSFYEPILKNIFFDDNIEGLKIRDVRKSVYDWIFFNQPYGIVDNQLYIGLIAKKLFLNFKLKSLKKDLLELVGHMEPNIENALEIGFLSMPFLTPKNHVTIPCNLYFEQYPHCELIPVKYDNVICIKPEISRENSLINLVLRFNNPLSLNSVFQNQRP